MTYLYVCPFYFIKILICRKLHSCRRSITEDLTDDSIFWAKQEIPYILWNSNIHYHFHKISPLAPIPIQINSVYALPSYFWKMILFSDVHLDFPSGLLQIWPSKHYVYPFFPYVLHVPLLSFLIWSPDGIWWREPFCYANFSSPLLLPFFLAQISSSAPCS